MALSKSWLDPFLPDAVRASSFAGTAPPGLSLEQERAWVQLREPFPVTKAAAAKAKRLLGDALGGVVTLIDMVPPGDDLGVAACWCALCVVSDARGETPRSAPGLCWY